MTKRINIMLSDRLNDMLDELSDAYGVSKSSIAAMAIGQHVEALMKQREMLYGDDGFMSKVKDRILAQGLKPSDISDLAEQLVMDTDASHRS